MDDVVVNKSETDDETLEVRNSFAITLVMHVELVRLRCNKERSWMFQNLRTSKRRAPLGDLRRSREGLNGLTNFCYWHKKMSESTFPKLHFLCANYRLECFAAGKNRS